MLKRCRAVALGARLRLPLGAVAAAAVLLAGPLCWLGLRPAEAAQAPRPPQPAVAAPAEPRPAAAKQLPAGSAAGQEGAAGAAAAGPAAAGALGAATPAGGDPEEVELRLPRGLGSVRIRLRGDLSGRESVDYVRRIGVDPASAVRSGALQFYRAEKGLLLQGEMRSSGVQGEERKGPCPPDVDPDVNRKKGRKCFPHDPDCGCHGPIMLPGMVGWAGGAGKGPHFFIYVGDGPNTFWGHDHTVWGQLADEQSMNAVKAVLDLPVSTGGGMRMLKQKVPFELRLSTR